MNHLGLQRFLRDIRLLHDEGDVNDLLDLVQQLLAHHLDVFLLEFLLDVPGVDLHVLLGQLLTHADTVNTDQGPELGVGTHWSAGTRDVLK